MKRILVIDDDTAVRLMLAGILKKNGYEVFMAPDGPSGLRAVVDAQPDLVITDFQMPGMTGLEVLDALKENHPDLPAIMLTAFGDATLTIKSIQTGAYDFIEKPIDSRELLEAVKGGIKLAEKKKHTDQIFHPGVKKSIDENLMVGKSTAMRELFKNIGRVSMSPVNVLITGETGTGKERVARLIHFSSENRSEPLVVINCNAVNQDELALELFGEIDGNPVIGLGGRGSRLREAGKGTVVLDEFPALSKPLQRALLDLMESGSAGIAAGCRIIGITSRNMDQLLADDVFLKELYYRIRVFPIHVSPLRQRKEDIPELVQHLIQQLSAELHKFVDTLEPGVTEMLQTHEWPGNVRELKNTLMQAMVLTQGNMLEKKNLILPQSGPVAKNKEISLPYTSLEEMEKEHIGKVLSLTRWNKLEASRLLGITRPTLNAKIEKYGLSQN